MSLVRNGGLAALLAASLAVSGCSTVRGLGDRLNPFDNDDDAAEAVASEGQRISIIAFEEQLQVADTLKGADFFLPTATAQASWPLPGGSPEQSIEHVAAGAAFDVAWRRGFGKGSDNEQHLMTPPVSDGANIYVMDANSTVAAISAADGRVVWRQELPERMRRDRHAFGGGIALADGKLYVSSGHRYVIQMDAATGSTGWQAMTASPIHAAPTVAGDRVFVVTTDNELLAFSASTGAPDWNYQALIEPARVLRASSPAISGDTIVAPFASGELVALRAANGNDLWSQALSRANRTNALSEIRDIAGRPVIYRGDVFAGSHSGVFSAIDLRTGQPRWNLPIASIASPWPAGDVVYVVGRDGEVVCAARETGQIYWIRDLNEGVEDRRSRGGMFSFLRRGGKGPPVWSSPILASDRLVLGNDRGQLVALNPKTGETVATQNLGGGALIGPIAVGDKIFVVTDEADLVAIR